MEISFWDFISNSEEKIQNHQIAILSFSYVILWLLWSLEETLLTCKVDKPVLLQAVLGFRPTKPGW